MNFSSYLQSYAYKYLYSVLSRNYNSIEIGGYNPIQLYLFSDKDYLENLGYLLFFHHNTQLKMFTDLCAADYPTKKNRFFLLYNLLCLCYNFRMMICIWANEINSVLSLTGLYPSANWYEREVWDLYGVHFENHPDLRRILTDYGFVGHPFRKDFPLVGFSELYYNYNVLSVCKKAVTLVQEYRNFGSRKSW